MQREHCIRCRLSREDKRSGEDWLGFEIDGKHHEIKLKIAELTEKLVHNPPAVISDLVEIAACVYGADSAISRGGPVDQGMGKLWRRQLHFEIPVREPDLWNSEPVTAALTETLGFLSDDSYGFTFIHNQAPRQFEGYLEFGSDETFAADEVMLFSGGLDSLAGALDELMSRDKSVALVSHNSSTKITRVQRKLIGELKKRTSGRCILHVPVTAHLMEGTNKEPTHRTRSFFFAVLGIATARIFGRDRVRFYENGVISLNLPLAGQVVGARATRTTHPQSLAGFGRLFSAIFGNPVTIANPFIWKTKREVLDVIAQHDAADLIHATHSCAKVHPRSNAEPHCGLCSQCIDRRFAVLAAGLAEHDPEGYYAVDLLRGPRTDVRDREMALGYLRQARRFRAMTPEEFMISFGEVSRALNYFDDPSGVVAKRIHDLHRRHGETVAAVMEGELTGVMTRREVSSLNPDCLLRMAGEDVFRGQQSGRKPSVRSGAASLLTREQADLVASQDTGKEEVQIIIQAGGRSVEIAEFGPVSGATAEVLTTLAEPNLEAAGGGRARADHPCITAHTLAEKWGLDGDEPVRKRVNRARGMFKRMSGKAGHPPLEDNAIIENVPYKGYRLNPWRVRVTRR
jgi:7-cyano-7-deazaguanine synthase in queuosine biosynthesis